MLVQVAHTAHELVHEVPVVRVRERLGRLNDAVQVRVEQLHHDVQLVVAFVAKHVEHGDHVVVRAEQTHQPDFAQHVLRVSRVRGHRPNAFDRNLALALRVGARAHDAVRASPNRLELRVTPRDLESRAAHVDHPPVGHIA